MDKNKLIDIKTVVLSNKTKKQLKKCPDHIGLKLQMWAEMVGENGLRKTRRIPGFHDEPLKGKRKGQRSIRLSRSYRAIYKLNKNKKIEFILVEEVNNHDY